MLKKTGNAKDIFGIKRIPEALLTKENNNEKYRPGNIFICYNLFVCR